MTLDTTWIVFISIVFVMLAIDLGVFNRKAHEIKMKEAVILSIFWISLGLAFNIAVYYWFGEQKALQFLTGYILEKSLSVDNLFVFILIFSYFNTNPKFQHKILFWGIIGALITRGIFIFSGITLINNFHYIIYGFGIFLIYAGIKLTYKDDEKIDPSENFIIKRVSKYLPILPSIYQNDDGKFIVHKGKYFVTPLLIILLVVESTDVMFAFDSVPAILSVTTDPFIVYTSNVFAILGLRALYFVLARIMPMFYYLSYGLSAILIFIGTKMLISDYYEIPIALSLGIVGSILMISVISSMIRCKENIDNVKI